MRQALRLSILVTLLIAGSVTVAAPDFKADGPAPGNLRFAWIHGSLSAKHNTDVRIQVHQYNAHTFILRQNPAIHWEAPFMYLLIGSKRALLVDTGATEEAEYFPLRETVDAVLTRWQAVNKVKRLELLVAPLGSEFSQVQGLGQFEDRPDTRILAATDAGRAELFGKGKDQAEIDLGGRRLDVLPTPGLDAQAVTLYDRYTDILLTGNTFYAGRLVIRDFDAYKATLAELVAFANDNPVRYIMGGRIEMTVFPGVDYRLRANYRPNEHALPLGPGTLADGYAIVHLINGATDIRIHDEFIVMNGVGRGARDYGWPTYTPAAYRRPTLR